MKKLTLAIVVMAVVGFNSASAEMVDIGLGQMERSEFVALKAMVQGRQTANVPALATPINRPERYGLVEMDRADFEALRDKVAGRSVEVAAQPGLKAVARMVNIGTGEMPLDEFIALKRMVQEGTTVFRFDHFAAVQP